MRARTRRALVVLGAALGLQGAGWLVYSAVERGREGSDDAAGFAYDEVDPPERVPNLTFEDLHGNPIELASYTARPLLLHFWATWCAPCRTELPHLLAYARQASSESSPSLLLVSLDENWQVIRHYFDDAVPPEVVRAVTRRAADELGVRDLPETLLLRPPGAVVARMRGARRWQSQNARSTVSKLTSPRQR